MANFCDITSFAFLTQFIYITFITRYPDLACRLLDLLIAARQLIVESRDACVMLVFLLFA